MFLVRLSREYKQLPKQFMEEIDSEEINWLLALEDLIPSLPDPYGINAINCYVTARVAGAKCKETDFLPKTREPIQTAEELKNHLRQLAARGK